MSLFVRKPVFEVSDQVPHKLYSKRNYNNNENLLLFFGLQINLLGNVKMHEALKTASKIKINHYIVVSWRPRISWKNRHFSAFKYTGVSLPVLTAIILFTLYTD